MQPNMSQTTNKYHVPALEKGLDILEVLAQASQPLSLADLARALDRSSSELFRMLNCLEARNYVQRKDDSGNYSLTLKLFELAHTHSPVDHLLGAAKVPMEQLAQSLEQSCHLSVLQHGKLIVISQALSPKRVRLSIEVGGQFPPIRTVSGSLLLAYLSEDELNYFLDNDTDYQSLSSADQDQFYHRLEHIRQTGVSVGEDETHYGIRDRAVMVGHPKIGVMAALAVAQLMAVYQPRTAEEIETGLLQCAATITNNLGLVP